MADIELELISVVRRHNARERASDASGAERDRMILAAADTGALTRRRLAEITGLSLQRIDQIIRTGRQAGRAA